MRILVTGFNPFGKHRQNLTERLARESDGRRFGKSLVAGRVLPTEYRRCERALVRAMRETRPEAVLLFGLAPGRKRLSLECVALNVDHSEKADNAGRRPWRRPIERRGPPLVEATLPVDRMHAALRRARLPVSISYHAGTYVCNHAFYVAGRRARGARVGFVHVPEKMSASRLRRALEVLVRSIGRGNSR